MANTDGSACMVEKMWAGGVRVECGCSAGAGRLEISLRQSTSIVDLSTPETIYSSRRIEWNQEKCM